MNNGRLERLATAVRKSEATDATDHAMTDAEATQSEDLEVDPMNEFVAAFLEDALTIQDGSSAHCGTPSATSSTSATVDGIWFFLPKTLSTDK
jgi:hypothetical protein